jgi:DNA-binding response OmpR family regulator
MTDQVSVAKKVLVIEDEKPMARALEVKLQKAGLEAHTVNDGQEGLNTLEKEHYDLALLDIMMPVMNGWEVLSKVKEKGINTKIIITSNLSQDEDKKKAKDLGAVDFIVKSNSTLTAIVEKVKSLL